ncbi:NAD(P)-dependent oxidoreductase [Nocardia alni]|uniref:NAD(P)-dependent oxidoreductase n=1 Tax=Nocardia alni TaxID=2815723 RepID=UPI001C21D652|nr:NAD(P)-dependent oxidoreductase [Nocardia alni]
MPDNHNAVAFLGLGNMGARMTGRLVAAGFDVIGFDPAEPARRTLIDAGGRTVDTAAQAFRAADRVILMLPSTRVVESVLDDTEIRQALRPGMTVIDMSSSEPLSTRRLAGDLAEYKVTLIDAPVSGGIAGATAGRLTIMAGGPQDVLSQLDSLFAPLGQVRHVGDTGTGHAVKAVNNLLSAVNLLAAAEGVAAATQFGVDPAVLIETINAASGRSAATELKFPQAILPETYNSGFALRLMLKDMRIATTLATSVGLPAHLGEQALALWSAADAALGEGADQTEIARWIAEGGSHTT